MLSTIICSTFVVSIRNQNTVQQEMAQMAITPEEKELIESLRNYNRSYPNGYPELLWDLQQLFDSMVRQPYE